MPRDTIHRSTRRNGFTLIEIMVVLVIVGVIATVAAPQYGNAIALRKIDAAAQRVVVDLTVARRNAMQTDSTQRVTFDPSADRYVLSSMADLVKSAADYVVELSYEPYSSDLSGADFGGDYVVDFDIYGVPDSDGWVALEIGSQRRWVTLDPLSGKAKSTTVKPAGAP